jgi:hypothetical protein
MEWRIKEQRYHYWEHGMYYGDKLSLDKTPEPINLNLALAKQLREAAAGVYTLDDRLIDWHLIKRAANRSVALHPNKWFGSREFPIKNDRFKGIFPDTPIRDGVWFR